ncbi:hypothetical protein BVY02_01530 [bacterium J17]|nr:hypothetical protein BVY02_01530 [bacterium J17]
MDAPSALALRLRISKIEVVGAVMRDLIWRLVLLTMASVSVSSCDRFSTIEIPLPERVLQSHSLARLKTSEELAVSSLKEFAEEIDYHCVDGRPDRTNSTFHFILLCGKNQHYGNRPLQLHRSENEFIVFYVEGRPFFGDPLFGESPRKAFCKFKDRMVSFYSKKFGQDKITFSAPECSTIKQ